MPRDRKGHGSEQRLTKRNRDLIDAVLNAGAEVSVKAIAAQVGYTERGAYRALAQPHVKRELQSRLAETMGTVTFAKASARYQQLIHADSEYVAELACRRIMEINGVRPATDDAPARGEGISLTINLPGAAPQTFGRTIDRAPAPASVPQPRVVTGLEPFPVARVPDGESA